MLFFQSETNPRTKRYLVAYRRPVCLRRGLCYLIYLSTSLCEEKLLRTKVTIIFTIVKINYTEQPKPQYFRLLIETLK